MKRCWFPIGTFPSAHDEDVEQNRPSVRFNSRGKWSPDTDIYEVQDGLIIIMDIAGLRREEISISVEGKILIIAGVRRTPAIPQKKQVHRLEIDVGHFEKRFRIPDDIEAGKIEATYESGFLYVSLPKFSSRRIEIIS